jgi:geranylgeranyl diphosphate synthase, type II
MLSLEAAQKIIADRLEKLKIPNEPEKLYDPVRYILKEGGKRLRPALVLIACDLYGTDYNKAIYPALGVEVFHNFTLLHDDLMDNSTVRRNRATVHIKWNPNTAILSGDAMCIIANKLMSMVDSNSLVPVCNLFNKTALEVCEGQMLDMEYSERNDVSIPQYINMIRLKTSVLIAASLGIGSIIGGATEKDSTDLYNFGLNIGIAFQLQDDLLDSFGVQDIFGKKIGNDIVTNKRTFLVIKAFEKSKGSDLQNLKKYFSGEQSDPAEKIKQVIKIYNKLEIRKETENLIREYHNKALICLNSLSLAPERKKILIEFADTLMKREK